MRGGGTAAASKEEEDVEMKDASDAATEKKKGQQQQQQKRGEQHLPDFIEQRTYDEECSYIENRDPTSYTIKVGFVPNMRVPGIFYVNKFLAGLTFEELKQHAERGRSGGFLPAVKQIANVASLPGIVGRSIALPDVHSGYGLPLGI